MSDRDRRQTAVARTRQRTFAPGQGHARLGFGTAGPGGGAAARITQSGEHRTLRGIGLDLPSVRQRGSGSFARACETVRRSSRCTGIGCLVGREVIERPSGHRARQHRLSFHDGDEGALQADGKTDVLRPWFPARNTAAMRQFPTGCAAAAGASRLRKRPKSVSVSGGRRQNTCRYMFLSAACSDRLTCAGRSAANTSGRSRPGDRARRRQTRRRSLRRASCPQLRRTRHPGTEPGATGSRTNCWIFVCH